MKNFALLLVLAAATLTAPAALQAQAIPPEALAIAKESYVQIETFPVVYGEEGQVIDMTAGQVAGRVRPGSVGSGIQLPGGLVITVAHAMEIKEDLRANRQAAEAEIVTVWPGRDLMLLRTGHQAEPNFKLANPQVGETVFTYANAGGENGFLAVYTVAKVNASFLYLDRNLFPGSSGGGIWNIRGELVGIVNGDRAIGSNEYKVGYGVATRSQVIAEFLTTRYRPAQVVMACKQAEPPNPNAKRKKKNS